MDLRFVIVSRGRENVCLVAISARTGIIGISLVKAGGLEDRFGYLMSFWEDVVCLEFRQTFSTGIEGITLGGAGRRNDLGAQMGVGALGSTGKKKQ
jgi:hypothetical protein